MDAEEVVEVKEERGSGREDTVMDGRKEYNDVCG